MERAKVVKTVEIAGVTAFDVRARLRLLQDALTTRGGTLLGVYRTSPPGGEGPKAALAVYTVPLWNERSMS